LLRRRQLISNDEYAGLGKTMKSWQIGDVVITRVLEFETPFVEPQVLYPTSSAGIIERHRAWLEPKLLDPVSGRLTIAFHSLVIRTPNLTILVDTCSGNDKERPHKTNYHRKQWPYLANLAAAGVSPESVDCVLCTHLHADHVGWNTRLSDGQWVPTFPRARYLLARTEWEYWRVSKNRDRYTTDPYFEDSVLPIVDREQMEFVSMSHVVDDWVQLAPTPGHTPGHVNVIVRSNDSAAVLSGDLMHTALQCAEPQLNSCFCVSDTEARSMRCRFLDQYADTSTLILPAHFPTPTAGWIRSDGRAFRFHFERS
jgi:glyoxylase-like metal-dependent hydrolase (beta-lactamase superfamily II)